VYLTLMLLLDDGSLQPKTGDSRACTVGWIEIVKAMERPKKSVNTSLTRMLGS